MAEKKPLCLYNGRMEELRSGDTLAQTASIPYVKRSTSFRIVGDINCAALTSVSLTVGRQYFIPLVVPRTLELSGLRISITTAATGQANLGIYNNTVIGGGYDNPGTLLAQITTLIDTSTIGSKDGTFSPTVTLMPGTLYWVSLISNAAITVRALSVASTMNALGRLSESNSAVTYLYSTGSGTTLANPAPTSLTNSTGLCPAIYLLES